MRGFNAGVAITDEPVACTATTTYQSATVYVGYLAEIPEPEIIGWDTDTTLGIFTAAGGSGRRTVRGAGAPQAGEVTLDVPLGVIYLNSADGPDTLYARYVGHGDVLETARVHEITFPTLPPDDSSSWYLLGEMEADRTIRIAEIEMMVLGNYANTDSTQIALLIDDTSFDYADVSEATYQTTFAAGTSRDKNALSSEAVIRAGQVLSICSTGGDHLQGLQLRLLERKDRKL